MQLLKEQSAIDLHSYLKFVTPSNEFNYIMACLYLWVKSIPFLQRPSWVDGPSTPWSLFTDEMAPLKIERAKYEEILITALLFLAHRNELPWSEISLVEYLNGRLWCVRGSCVFAKLFGGFCQTNLKMCVPLMTKETPALNSTYPLLRRWSLYSNSATV